MIGVGQQTTAADLLSSNPPKQEGVAPAAGDGSKASRDDHVHERLTSASNHTLDAFGFAEVTFTRQFDAEPSIIFGAIGAGNSPVPTFRAELMKTGNMWTGARVYGERAAKTAKIEPITGITLLVNLIPVLNTIFNGQSEKVYTEPAAGARVSVTALKTTVPSA